MINRSVIAIFAGLMITNALTDASAEMTSEAPFATPPGITLQLLGKAQGYGLDAESASFLTRHQIAYADARGMTLYTMAADPNGKSVCNGECTRTWRPALVASGVKALGNWSIIKRDDGKLQWALNGKPVYTYIKDVDIGSVGGNSPKILGRGPLVGPRGALKGEKPKELPLPEGLSPALSFPAAGVDLPNGFAIKEIPDALGLVLVNHEARTLYTFKDDPNTDSQSCVSSRSCNDWQPLAAPQLAKPVGDFGFVVRNDGIRQWTYKGRALYTYASDLVGSDYANGVDVDRGWQAAYVLRYYMPEGVRVTESLRLGKILATAAGQTLYVRNGFITQSGGGHGTRHGNSFRPAVGRDLGADPRCRRECDKWHPYLAPANAHPQGYWGVVDRSDGSRQRVYNGYALWTYDGDQQPGDIMAQDTFDIAFSDSIHTVLDVGTPYDGPTALYWTVTPP